MYERDRVYSSYNNRRLALELAAGLQPTGTVEEIVDGAQAFYDFLCRRGTIEEDNNE